MELDLEVFTEVTFRLCWDVPPGESVGNWDAFSQDIMIFRLYFCTRCSLGGAVAWGFLVMLSSGL